MDICVHISSFSLVCMYMDIYVRIYEELFSKILSPNLALALQHHFLDWRLTLFEKELFTYSREHTRNTERTPLTKIINILIEQEKQSLNNVVTC